MSERTTKWAAGYAAIDFALLAMASELDTESTAGTWKDYTFSAEYPLESKQGKHPGSFGSFLEGHAFDLQEQGYQVSRGDLESILDVYRWGTSLGATREQMAYLGLALLRRIYKQYKKKPAEGAQVIAEAFASKQQHGKYHLPSFGPPEPTPRFSVETQDLGDGTYQLLALIVTKDGVQYKNRWPKELLHYLCSRLRASNITRDFAIRN
jgi:hypothetical protein